MIVKLGEPIPLFIRMDDMSTNRIVTAEIIDPDSGDTLFYEVPLQYKSGSPGHYSNNAISMPNLSNIEIIYLVYDDDDNLLDTVSSTVSLAQTSSGSGGGESSTKIYADDMLLIIDEDVLIAEIEEQETLTVTIDEEGE